MAASLAPCDRPDDDEDDDDGGGSAPTLGDGLAAAATLGVGVSDTTPGAESTPRAGGAVPASTDPPPCAEAIAAASGVAPVTASGVVACVRAAAMEAAWARELAVMTALNCRRGGGKGKRLLAATTPPSVPLRPVPQSFAPLTIRCRGSRPHRQRTSRVPLQRQSTAARTSSRQRS